LPPIESPPVPPDAATVDGDSPPAGADPEPEAGERAAPRAESAPIEKAPDSGGKVADGTPAEERPAEEKPAAAGGAPDAEAPASDEPPAEERPAEEKPAAAGGAPDAEAPASDEPPAGERPAGEKPADPTAVPAPAGPVVASAADTAKQLEAATAKEKPLVTPRKGRRLGGKIIQIGEDSAFVDFGGREEGVIDIREMKDAEGNLTRKVGDTVRAMVVRVEGGVKLSLKAGRVPGNLPAVLEAVRAGVPVTGKVTGVNKGGLVVNVMGVRSFCPFSQIDRHYVENPAEFVGKRLTFRVSSADERGKNVVLSRRAHVEEEAREKADELRKTLEVGQVLRGTVARIRPFGAFVDLGGIDGLIHVSEISHSRVKNPAEVLEVGQSIEVQVVGVENLGKKSERISLSRKRLESDPWDEAAEKLVPGEKVEGKIVRLVDFGAFVELFPGVDGLIHVSALASDHRVKHPSEIVEAGQTVEVWVVSVDRGARRVSLSFVDPAVAPARREGGGQGRREGGRRSGKQRDSEHRRVSREEHQRSGSPDSGLTSMGEAFERLRQRMGSQQ
jgi:small subunit ribosomal protein S1